MRFNMPLVLLLALTIIVTSCKKENVSNVDCFLYTSTVRQIINQPATIKIAGGLFYIVEHSTIDTKLIPCNLSQEFQISNLQVIVSGEVKSSITNAGEPCCSENFVIKKITK